MKFSCINCNFNYSENRLGKCSNCNQIVDELAEFKKTISVIGMLLCRISCFRHLFYNKFRYKTKFYLYIVTLILLIQIGI